MALGVGRGEIDIGVGEARIEFDRPARRTSAPSRAPSSLSRLEKLQSPRSQI